MLNIHLIFKLNAAELTSSVASIPSQSSSSVAHKALAIQTPEKMSEEERKEEIKKLFGGNIQDEDIVSVEENRSDNITSVQEADLSTSQSVYSEEKLAVKKASVQEVKTVDNTPSVNRMVEKKVYRIQIGCSNTAGATNYFEEKYDVFVEEMNSKYYEWQEPFVELLKTKPNNRTIEWIVGKSCNEGKTIFQKHLIQIFEGVIQTGGCAHDMKNGVIEYMKKSNNKTPKIVLMNIPKTQDNHYVSYQGIEQIKDMCFFSGKYESGQVLGRSPHILVFANEPPNLEGVDPKRWNITYINSDE